ncbi:hypothetical protein FOZ61_010919 [Perkinsus olseni]|uniref:Reverse transcriptase domain-containing protein n=1 Tax=Perkinsus olseni TaxID=32597 RepID=A0A7J6M1X4_PEROL|nr:hypothetical protein FOZ61_010919 [Perkinsus olseni]
MTCIYQLNCGKRTFSVSSILGILSALAILPSCLALQECPADLGELTKKYLWFRADRGNAAVLVRQDIKSISLTCEKDLVAVSLRECIVISMYMHPTDMAQRTHIKELLGNSAPSWHVPSVLCADVNAWNALWGSRMSSFNTKNQAWTRGSKLLMLLEDLDFQVINDPESPPTFIGGRGCSWIDITAVRKWNKPTKWEFSPEGSGSDHRLIITTLKLPIDTTQRLALRLTDVERVRNRVRNFVATNSTPTAVSLATELSRAVRESTPTLSCRLKPGWWTTRLEGLKQRLKRLQRRVHRRFLRGALRGDLEQELKDLRTAYRAELSDAKSRARKRFFEGQADYCKLVRPPRVSSVPSSLEGCPESENTAAFILRRLFPRFDSGHRLLWRIRHLLGPNRVVPPVTVRELEQVVSRFRDGSPGEDHINNDILKQTLSDLKDVWARTFTTLLNERVHPEEFKRGRGLLLLKPHRDLAKVSSWRPVVLQSCVSKMLEGVVSDRIYHEIASSLHCPGIFGFVRSKSSDQAVHRICSHYRSGMQRGHVVAVCLDVRNAFNCLRHDYIIKSLVLLNTSEYLVSFIRSYLHNQSVTVELGIHDSSITLQVGVPQGSRLGPLLFTASTISLVRELRKISGVDVVITAYADDLTIVLSGPSRKHIRGLWARVKKCLNRWCDASGLTIDMDKSSCLSPRKPPQLSLKGKVLERRKVVRVLGVHLDQRMNFRFHVKNDLRGCHPAAREVTSDGDRKGWAQHTFSAARKFSKYETSPALMALVTGQLPTPHLRHLQRLRATPTCPCGAPDGSTIHLAQECPLLDSARKEAGVSSQLLLKMRKMVLILPRRFRATLSTSKTSMKGVDRTKTEGIPR